MGKLLLISGANGSGKSRWAENLVSQTVGPRYYIATMQPYTEENHRRIVKHIQQRAGLNFVTLEIPSGVDGARVTGDSVVLLEDVANLLSNSLFGSSRTRRDVEQEIAALQSRCKLLLAVTIEGLTEEGYDGETAAYIRDLNRLNSILLEKADGAVHVQNHCPTWVKGDLHDIL